MPSAACLQLPAFVAALDARRIADNLTWRQVAERTGVSASTLSRVQDGKLPDLTTFAALLRWLKLPAETFLGLEPPPEDPSLLSVLVGGHTPTPEQAAALANLVNAAQRLAQVTAAPAGGAPRSSGRRAGRGP